MKSTELRVGNYVESFGIPRQVDGQLIVSLIQIELADKIPIDISPIVLTEPIVQKIRFVVSDDFKPIVFRRQPPNERQIYNHYLAEIQDNIFLEIAPCYENQERISFWFSWIVNQNNGYFMPISDIHGPTRLMYLHQLQNLFFALSGKELYVEL